MKYAILLECDPNNTLGGSCIRDVKNMSEHLISRCNFKQTDIHILTTNQSFQKSNSEKYQIHPANQFTDIVNSIKKKTCEHDTIIILISGHGYQTQDTNRDENDGLDEMISIGSRNIIDDEIYILINDIKCKVIMLSDTCHSGSMFDLPNNDFRQKKIGNLISISACSDSQLSMCDIGEKTGFGGSLTTSVLEDGILEVLINGDIFVAFNKIRDRLHLLNQNAILSSN